MIRIVSRKFYFCMKFAYFNIQNVSIQWHFAKLTAEVIPDLLKVMSGKSGRIHT